MKRFLLFALAVIVFAACSKDAINEQQNMQTIVDEAPETITVGFEGDDTRIQLNEAQKTVWTKDDIVSVFYKSNANQKWKYRGETGERVAELYRVDAGTASRDMDYVVLAYPYSTEYVLSTATGNIEATLPAVQHYLKDSYGVGSNLMVSKSEFTQFSLKSVCGWLKLQLTGDGEVVKSITFKGNDGEQVAGLIHVDTATAEATLAAEMGSADDNNAGGNLVFDDTILTEVTLDCGEGVALGKEATAFYIALPPQTFEKGFKVEIVCADDTKMVMSSNKALSIERNHIQPMTAMEFTPSVPNNQIWYTSYYGDIVEPNNTNVFGANIVSNTYTNGKGVITFDGDVTTIGDETFVSCYSLTSVTIGDSVTTIGEGAFADCTSLTSVNIPDSVTTIGDLAFYYCTSLTSVNIGNSVTRIGYCAFHSCTSLTSVTIGDSVTTIGEGAFEGCTSLTSFTIGDSVTVESVAEALRYCRSLQEFKGKFASEDGRCLIDDGVLYYVAPGGLTAYTIPDSVTEIGSTAFYGCDSLTSVYCKATTPPTLGGTVVFDYNGSGRKIYVPRQSVNVYKNAKGWKKYADAIVGYDF